MTQRNLFAELEEGFEALAEERAGNMTLPKHIIDSQSSLEITVTAVDRAAAKQRPSGDSD